MSRSTKMLVIVPIKLATCGGFENAGPMSRCRFTAIEDDARDKIVSAMKRLDWGDVSAQLCNLGFQKRTVKSIRNRHLRMKIAQSSRLESKNYCRGCGLPQRGHVCRVLKSPNPPSKE